MGCYCIRFCVWCETFSSAPFTCGQCGRFWILHFTRTDGESDKTAEIICWDERVRSWGQLTATRASEFSPQVRSLYKEDANIWHLENRFKDRSCLMCVCMLVCVCRKMDKLQQENLELVRRLAAQEEALGYSNRQLGQRSSESQALSRQLEAALSDVKQQVQSKNLWHIHTKTYLVLSLIDTIHCNQAYIFCVSLFLAVINTVFDTASVSRRRSGTQEVMCFTFLVNLKFFHLSRSTR